jgi:hypothetical protein
MRRVWHRPLTPWPRPARSLPARRDIPGGPCGRPANHKQGGAVKRVPPRARRRRPRAPHEAYLYRCAGGGWGREGGEPNGSAPRTRSRGWEAALGARQVTAALPSRAARPVLARLLGGRLPICAYLQPFPTPTASSRHLLLAAEAWARSLCQPGPHRAFLMPPTPRPAAQKAAQTGQARLQPGLRPGAPHLRFCRKFSFVAYLEYSLSLS